LTDRKSTIAEFDDYLRRVNNRDGRPYEEKTISVYVGCLSSTGRLLGDA
jgi:hypothetical protein